MLSRLFQPSYGMGFLGLDSHDLDHATERMISSHRGEIEEDDKEIRLKTVLPGVPREDIKIDVQGNVLTMKVARDKKESGKDEAQGIEWHRSQMQDVMKSWRLPSNTDLQKIKASTKHGILTINVPKIQLEKEKQKKQITVEGE